MLAPASGVLLALLVTVACAHGPSSAAPRDDPGAPPELSRSSSGDAAEMPGRKPAQPPSDGKGTDVPASQIDSSGLPKGYPVEVSTLDDGRTLRVVGKEGGCSKASAEVAGQRGDRVTVRMVETKPSDPTTICTMDIRYPPLTVELDEPLGKRLVVLTYVERRE